MKKISKKIIGITGGHGALGSQLIKNYKNKYDFRIYKKRIENEKNFKNWLSKNSDIEILIHLAAIVSIIKTKKDPKRTLKINSNATIKIIKTLNKAKLEKFNYFLLSSTSHVYKPSFYKLKENSSRSPITIYGKSKKKVEDFIFKNKKKLNFKVGIARIFNFYSENHKKGIFIYDIKKKLLENKKIVDINRINTPRDYININQVCEILIFMVRKRISLALNVASGTPLNLIDLIKSIKKKLNSKSKLNFEIKRYPGLFANIKLLRKVGYKKKITKFKF